jgi:twitching motility two-component system response regulator PilH
MATVLVIDDSIFQRKSICSSINEVGYDTIEAGNGREGLELALSSRPDIIFTDLLMPEMDGIQLLSALKEHGCNCPVFVLTADIQESKRKQCIELGISGFLSKPCKKRELIDVLNQAVNIGKEQ